MSAPPHQHDFVLHYFKRPTNCDVCLTLLVGVFDKQGVRCTLCRMNSHSHYPCLSTASTRTCCSTSFRGAIDSSLAPPSPAMRRKTGEERATLDDQPKKKRPHDFKLSSFLVPTYCGACKGILSGLANQGLRCSSCHLTCHRGEGQGEHGNCQAELLFTACCGEPSSEPVSGDYNFGDLTRQIAADLRSIVREGVMDAIPKDNVVVPLLADLAAKAASVSARFGGRWRALAREFLAMQCLSVAFIFVLSFVLTMLHARRLSLEALRLAAFSGSSSAIVLLSIEAAIIAAALGASSVLAHNADICHEFVKRILKIDLFSLNVDVFASAMWVRQLLILLIWVNVFFLGLAYSNWASRVQGMLG